MKVTYLLGAGASAQTLPVIGNMTERITQLIYSIKNISPGFQDVRHTAFVSDLQILANIASTHSSVDTYAKKLYLMKDYEQLNFFKNLLSIYLTLETMINGVDLRYDSFLASILGESADDFADNIQILSWNYDYQFEASYAQICKLSSFDDVRKNLFYNDNYSAHFSSSQNNFSYTKLNGSIGYFDVEKSNRVSLISNINQRLWQKNKIHYQDSAYLNAIENIPEFDKLINNYSEIKKHPYRQTKSSIKFAWEKEGQLELYKQAISRTNILVVVGYSFPFFNRNIDRMLFGRGNIPVLSKVYIQDKEPNKIKLRFKSIRDDINSDRLEGIDEVDQFFIPYEL